MLKLLRYTLAAIFLAASVGCLGLWGWSYDCSIEFGAPNYFANAGGLTAIAAEGMVDAGAWTESVDLPQWRVVTGDLQSWLVCVSPRDEQFGVNTDTMYFPLWYPALVFALASVGVLRLGKPFTIRSALIATTVVAVLLGMVVAL